MPTLQGLSILLRGFDLQESLKGGGSHSNWCGSLTPFLYHLDFLSGMAEEPSRGTGTNLSVQVECKVMENHSFKLDSKEKAP